MSLLPLTPFEEYMFLDGNESYPMNCFVRMRFSGYFDRDRFARAAKISLVAHPLFQARLVTPRAHRFFWELANLEVPILWQKIENAAQSVTGRAFDLTLEPPLRLHLLERDIPERASGETDLVLEFHHSASDGVGSYDFLADLLRAYHDNSLPAITRDEAIFSLTRRADFATSWRESLALLPSQLWGFFRARKFLFNRPEAILPYTPPPKNENASQSHNLPHSFPAIIETHLDAAQFDRVRVLCKSKGVTVNDFLLAAFYQAVFAWRVGEGFSQSSNYLRIAVPTSLRRRNEKLATAANRVSMVFLDRTQRDMHEKSFDGFLRSIAREMSHIKRHELGWAFIFGLTALKNLFGGIHGMVQQKRCWSSCVLSNLGQPLINVALPRKAGEILIDGAANGGKLRVIEFSTAPPIRAWTEFGIGVLTYNNRMFIALHYDPRIISSAAAQRFLTQFVTIIAPSPLFFN